MPVRTRECVQGSAEGRRPCGPSGETTSPLGFLPPLAQGSVLPGDSEGHFDSEGAGENPAPCTAGRPPPPPPGSDVLFAGLGSFGPACAWPLRRGCSGDEGHQILECVAQGLGGWMQKLG